ncbi:MAG: ABC transporter permease [Paracholeplasma sp.]|uniref:Putative spermidine/putrescine ABC transporter, substrate binding n=1 Tax=Acholeplasma brassicae TaxID=61635 RepID=U4KP96_9MOLU|nr:MULTISPECIES: ABC transporter permease [Paracholeplasma]MDY3195753.1 ABC transporter permease [Paracholeplasma sp.]CCV66146.1 putative spermidine/putrescine ABC transporter, substrate binding [Paracholeplasma brassicae]HBT59398.1 ABC transporter permease [Acholeplasmataceae bacterium]
MTKLRKHASKIFMALVLLFIYAPILSMVIFSFNENKSLTRWGGFSFQWYEKLFDSQEIMGAVTMTILIAVVSTLISTIIGTFAALSLSKSKKLVKDIILTANNVPIVNPEIVTAVGLLLLFVSFQLPRGYLTMLLAHIAFSIPYVIITVYPKVRSLDPNLAEAAKDLGATPLQALRLVVFPEIKVAVIAGAAIAFTMSFDDFVISYFTAGSATNISIYLYTLKRGIEPTINALSTIIIVVIGLIVTRNFMKTKKIQQESEE